MLRELAGQEKVKPQAPGAHSQVPTDGIRKTLEADGRLVLLVVDQLEQLLTGRHSPSVCDEFFETLAEVIAIAPERLRVVLVVRSDFEPSFEPPRRSGWNEGRFLVPPMTPAELREAVVAPASEIACSFEPPELVDELVSEVIQMPGALPLLSFTLSEMYEAYVRRADRDHVLRRKDYLSLGGVSGALRHRADTIWDSLKAQGLETTARRLLLRMVSLEAGEIARRRVTAPELTPRDRAERSRLERVIEVLDDARLTVGRVEIEPAHDALVRGWGRIRQWIRDDEESILLTRRLTQAAAEWERGDHADGLLWDDDPRLAGAERLLGNDPNNLSHDEGEFVMQSVRRARRNRRVRFGITAAVVTFLGVATVVALTLRQEAATQAQLAGENLAASRFFAADVSWRDRSDPLHALLLAASAIAASPEDDPRRAAYVLRAMHLVSRAPRIVTHVPAPVSHYTLSQDGQRVVTVGGDGVVRQWDLRTGAALPVPEPAAPGLRAGSAAIGPRGLVAVVDWDGHRAVQLRVAGLVSAGGAPGARIIAVEGDDNVADFAFAPDGRELVVARRTAKKTLRYTVYGLAEKRGVFDVAPELTADPPLPGEDLPIRPGALSLIDRPGWVTPVAGDENRAFLVGIHNDESAGTHDVSVLDLSADEPRTAGVVHAEGHIDAARLSADGSTLVVIARTGTDCEVGAYHRPFQGGWARDSTMQLTGRGRILGLTPTGDRALVTQDSRSVPQGQQPDLHVFGTRSAEDVRIALGKDDVSSAVVLTSDGADVVAISKESEVRVWGAASGVLRLGPEVFIRQAPGVAEELGFDLREDRGRLTTVTHEGTVMQWDPLDRGPASQVKLPLSRVASAAFSADARMLAAVTQTRDEQSALFVFDLATSSSELRRRIVDRGTSLDVALSDDGARLATVVRFEREEYALHVWDLGSSSERPLCNLTLTGAHTSAATTFRAGGKEVVATWGSDGNTASVQRWTVEGCKPIWATPWSQKDAKVMFTRGGDQLLFARLGPVEGRIDVRGVGDVLASGWLPVEVRAGLSGPLVTALLRDAQDIALANVDATVADTATPGLTVRLEDGRVELAAREGATVGRDGRTGLPLADPRLPQGLTPHLPLFSPAGKWLVLEQGVAQTIRRDDDLGTNLMVFSPTLGTTVTERLWHDHRVMALAFARGEQELITVTSDGVVRHWQVAVDTRGDKGWMGMLGEALTGLRMEGERGDVRVPASEYPATRKRFFGEVEQAAAAGDQVAAVILARFRSY
jgi:WD40 repeat protein